MSTERDWTRRLKLNELLSKRPDWIAAIATAPEADAQIETARVRQNEKIRQDETWAKPEVPLIVAPNALSELQIVQRRIEELLRLNRDLMSLNDEFLSRLTAKATKAEPGDHDYHGPVVDGKTVSDEVHERFHGAIGDVLAGKVMPKAREQMREALNRQLPDAPTTASKSRPMPGRALAFNQQQIGLRSP